MLGEGQGVKVTIQRSRKHSAESDRGPGQPVPEQGQTARSRRRRMRRHGDTWPRRGEEGAALVEFALILPLAVLVLFGLIDFGFIFQSYSQLRNGVEDGARLASINNASYTAPAGCGPTSGSATPTTDLVCAIVGDINPPLIGISSGTLTVGIAINTPSTPNSTGQQDIVVCASGVLNSTSGLLAKMLLGSHMGSSSTILAASSPLNFSAYNSGSTSIRYGSLIISGMNC